MNRERNFFLKRALLHSLADCAGYPVIESALLASAAIKADHLRPTTAELSEQLRSIDTEKLATGVNTERGRMWKLSVSGQMWIAENP